ncbi:MAG: hypothetical protein OEX76_00975 [Candidatus Bathyarchaeota archaeon]|nr:hypothetical protein [Candidatus Bathyarchaeota archaeon]
MEPMIRGLLEKILDKILEPSNLENLSKTYDVFRPIIKSKEDALFGEVVGTFTERYCQLMLSLKRFPTNNELTELFDIITRRADEIRSKILMATST